MRVTASPYALRTYAVKNPAAPAIATNGPPSPNLGCQRIDHQGQYHADCNANGKASGRGVAPANNSVKSIKQRIQDDEPYRSTANAAS